MGHTRVHCGTCARVWVSIWICKLSPGRSRESQNGAGSEVRWVELYLCMLVGITPQLVVSLSLAHLSLSTLSNLSWRTARHILVSFKRFILLLPLLSTRWLPLCGCCCLPLCSLPHSCLSEVNRNCCKGAAEAELLPWNGSSAEKCRSSNKRDKKKETGKGNRRRSVGKGNGNGNGKCYPISKSK